MYTATQVIGAWFLGVVIGFYLCARVENLNK